jgi:hypothetical protein
MAQKRDGGGNDNAKKRSAQILGLDELDLWGESGEGKRRREW